MNETYFTVSPLNTDENNDVISYMTVEGNEHFTELPNDSGKPIVYFTQKELAEKYIKRLTTDTKLYVSEIKHIDVPRLEWICCYDYNIPIKLNAFWVFILGGVSLSGSVALFIWVMERMTLYVKNTNTITIIDNMISSAFIIILLAYIIKVLINIKRSE